MLEFVILEAQKIFQLQPCITIIHVLLVTYENTSHHNVVKKQQNKQNTVMN